MEQTELPLLLVTCGHSRYGICAEQVACLADAAGNTQPAVRLEKLLSATAAPSDKPAKLLFVKQRASMPILINEPDEITAFALSAICRLPAALTAASGSCGVWGLLPQPSGLIILIDFYKNQRFNQLAGTQASHKERIV